MQAFLFTYDTLLIHLCSILVLVLLYVHKTVMLVLYLLTEHDNTHTTLGIAHNSGPEV